MDIQPSGTSQYFRNERVFDTVIKNYFGALKQRSKFPPLLIRMQELASFNSI
jgi:hypothetical protein